MKKIVTFILILTIICILSGFVFADANTQLSDIKDNSIILLNNSTGITFYTNKWIDPTSSNKHVQDAIINYKITPNNFKGTIVPEISNNKNTYILNPIKVTRSSGSFKWNGKVNNKQINHQAILII